MCNSFIGATVSLYYSFGSSRRVLFTLVVLVVVFDGVHFKFLDVHDLS